METTLIKFAESKDVFGAFDRVRWYEHTNYMNVVIRELAEEYCRITKDPDSYLPVEDAKLNYAYTDEAKAILHELYAERLEIEWWIENINIADEELGIDERHMSSADYMKAWDFEY